MIGVDYRATRTGGFAFYVASSHPTDKLVTMLRAVASADMLPAPGLAASPSDVVGGWHWMDRDRYWVVQRYSWNSFLTALRKAHPDDEVIMTDAAESASLEDFIDATLKGDNDPMVDSWMVFGLRTDAHWNIAISSMRAVTWAALEVIKQGRQDLALTPYSPRSIVIAFLKLHRVYGEPEMPIDVVETLRRLASVKPSLGTVSRDVLQIFSNWEQRMSSMGKILKRAGKG